MSLMNYLVQKCVTGCEYRLGCKSEEDVGAYCTCVVEAPCVVLCSASINVFCTWQIVWSLHCCFSLVYVSCFGLNGTVRASYSVVTANHWIREATSQRATWTLLEVKGNYECMLPMLSCKLLRKKLYFVKTSTNFILFKYLLISWCRTRY